MNLQRRANFRRLSSRIDSRLFLICCSGGEILQEPNSAVGSLDDTTLAPSVGAALRKFLAETFEEVITIEQEWTGVTPSAG